MFYFYKLKKISPIGLYAQRRMAYRVYAYAAAAAGGVMLTVIASLIA